MSKICSVNALERLCHRHPNKPAQVPEDGIWSYSCTAKHISEAEQKAKEKNSTFLSEEELIVM